DVTLQEDQILVKQPTQAHVLGALRTLVLGLFRKAGVRKVRALLDNLADSPTLFKQLLCQVGFLSENRGVSVRVGDWVKSAGKQLSNPPSSCSAAAKFARIAPRTASSGAWCGR